MDLGVYLAIIGSILDVIEFGIFKKAYVKQNPGSPFILIFILSLIVAAATYSFNPTLTNDIVTFTFFFTLEVIRVKMVY